MKISFTLVLSFFLIYFYSEVLSAAGDILIIIIFSE